MQKFKMKDPYKSIVQKDAINQLINGINKGYEHQVLYGATGVGKTYMMGKIIEGVNKPSIIISHNKTLAAQLYSEFKELFPNNAVEYFVSHYKYFQPEAYLPIYDKYIEKETMVNEDIERMRQHCAQSLLMRKDVIVVASVSALFGLGNPKTFFDDRLILFKGQFISQNSLLDNLVRKQYERTNEDLKSGLFKVCGDTILIMLSIDNDVYYRIEMFGDEIEKIVKIDNLTHNIIEEVEELPIFNISTYMVSSDKVDNLCYNIEQELKDVYNNFLENNEELYANRIKERTMYDIEMIREIGYCKGLESYQRYLTDRPAGSAPYSLLDFFPKDYLMFIDESHATIPQIKSISNQNSTIKENLIKYGFRLPSCVDNRPLSFSEFENIQNQVIYVSATPDEYEINKSNQIVEQNIRPTGLLDPKIEVRPIKGQIDDIFGEINTNLTKDGKVLITVLTQKMAEDLTDYLNDMKIKTCYIHSNVPTIDRVNIINDFQNGKYKVLVGCNLLREGLSISDCELVIIIDADKEGFLRNKTSLIQTIGRAARNVNGRAILYADKITKSMKMAIDETNRRRNMQEAYNKEHNIKPQTTKRKLIKNIIGVTNKEENKNKFKKLNKKEIDKLIKTYYINMEESAKNLDFEEAMKFRDLIQELESLK